VSSGFQFDGGEYAVPLVYSVSLRGKLVTEPPDDADADADADADVDAELLLLDGELLLLLQALAVASASTPSAAVPYRHRRAVILFVLTCSYLLTSKSSGNPGRVAAGSRKSPRAEMARQPLPKRPILGAFVRSRLGVAAAVSANPRPAPVSPLNRWAIPVKC